MKLPVLPFAFLFCACGFAGFLWIDWANVFKDSPECARWSPTYDLHDCAMGPLPRRPVDTLTNWGQGRAPADNVCPAGTTEFRNDENQFIECQRGNTP